MLHAFLEDLADLPWEEWFDSSRLIFADWLDERNDPRGQVLRDPDTYRWRCPLGVRSGLRVLQIEAVSSKRTVLELGRTARVLPGSRVRWLLDLHPLRSYAHLIWRPTQHKILDLMGGEWWEVDHAEGSTSIRMLLFDAAQGPNQDISAECWSLTREHFQSLWRTSLLRLFPSS